MKRSQLQSFLKKSQSVLEELYGDVIEIDGVAYNVAVSSRKLGGAMGMGGDIPDGLITIRVKKSILPFVPKDGKTLLRYDSRIWRVDDVKDLRVDEVWVLTCILASE